MKMKSKFFGINAKMALAALAVCGLFTSCYEKEEIDAPVASNPVYVITGNLISASTGEPVKGAKITITGAMSGVSVSNGSFSVTKTLSDAEAKEDKVGNEAYTIAVVADGYLNTERVVYLKKAAKGQISMATADIYLFDASTQVVVPEKDEEASIEQAESVKNAIKENVTDALKDFAGISSNDITAEVDADGNLKITVPATVNGAVLGENKEVEVPTFAGFASTITPDQDDIFTRALTDGQIWIASAEKLLGRAYGLKSVATKVTLKGAAGKSIAGYTLVITMNNKALQFNGANGIVTYQENVVITPKYDSHDSHDSHDGHGSNPGAGGGASGNY